MDIKDLKSEAYDILATISQMQARLQQINNAIANYKDPKAEKIVVEKEPKK